MVRNDSVSRMCTFEALYTDISCIGALTQLSQLQEDDRTSFLSDVGLTENKLTQNFTICESHKERFYLNKKSRLKGKYCVVPTHFSTHPGRQKIGDRKVTAYLLSGIHKVSGIILPIGSAICTSCRKFLLKDQKAEPIKDLVDLMEDDDPDTSRTDTDLGLLTEEGEILHGCRKRKCAMERDEFCYHLSDSESLGLAASTGCSQVSVASVSQLTKMEKLNEFLNEYDISPVKSISNKLEESSNRSKKRYVEKAKTCLAALFETICPGEGDILKDMVLQDFCHTATDEESSISEMLIKIFRNGETWTFKRQILSMLTKKSSFGKLKEDLPELSQWQFYNAKKHAEENECCEIVKDKTTQRDKVDVSKLEHFLDFITSSDIIKDLPFGERTLRLSTGELIKIPNVIRCLAPSSLVEQYNKVCEEEEFKPLGSSTLYKVLSDCGASVRQCMDGLDYYITEGGRAFQDLINVVHAMDLPKAEEARIKDSLLEGKHYLKTEYKVHVVKSSNVKDHCREFSLTDKEPAFQAICKHIHDSSCKQCGNLERILCEVQTLADNATWDNAEAVLFEVEKAIKDIEEWKKHILRARNQEDARVHILNSLSPDDVILTCDWAMKFLPRKYREGQTDWFAKRGINWHICVSLRMLSESVFSSITHVHIFDKPVSQDSSITTAAILEVVKDLQDLIPTLNSVHIFSDNAGCYKSANTLCCLHVGSNGIIKSYNFCEAQNGKGPCDRKSSNLKSLIKKHVNEGNDVVNARQMKQAIDKKQSGMYRVRVVEEVVDVDDKHSATKTIPQISLLHNFSFTSEGLTVWKQFHIGKGKFIPWDNILGKDGPKLTNFLVHLDWTRVQLDEFTDHSMDGEEEPTRKRIRVKEMFYCEHEGCGRSFGTQKSLENHMLLGSCNYKNEKQTLSDRAKSIYSDKLLVSNVSRQISLSTAICSGTESSLQAGWALKGTKSKVTFTDRQKEYMKEQFLKGKKTGNKVDPQVAASEMRNRKVNGVLQFTRSEFLTGQQIGSYFSRLALQERKMEKSDFDAAKEEIKQEELKLNILENIVSV